MSVINDPMMSLLMAQNSVASAMQQPQADTAGMEGTAGRTGGQGLAGLYAQHMARQQGQQQSARMSPQGFGTPVHTHFAQQMGQQPMQMPMNGRVAAPGSNPSVWASAGMPNAGASVGTPAYASLQAQGLEPQSAAPLMRGSYEEETAPKQGNDISGMLAGVSPEHAQVLQAYAQQGATPQQIMAARHQLEGATPKPTKAPSWRETNQEDLFHYQDIERQAARIDSQISKAESVEQQQHLQKQSDLMHQQLDMIGQRLYPSGAASKLFGNQPSEDPEARPGGKHHPLGGGPVTPEDVAKFKQQEQQQPQASIPRVDPNKMRMIAQFYQQAGGDKVKARELAAKAGFDFSGK